MKGSDSARTAVRSRPAPEATSLPARHRPAGSAAVRRKDTAMAKTIVVIGGSAAGMGAAGAAKQVDPSARIIVFTQLQDVAYSPCGIPYVHGREIDSFDRLI